jgi:predicted O-linked N-acetylglucosamine transferase (SPINDLY family)
MTEAGRTMAQKPQISTRRPAPAAVPDLKAVLSRAVACHQAGLLAEAEQLYRQILETHPRQFDCLNLLGVIQYQRGAYAEALRQLDRAIAVKAKVADAHNGRAAALIGLKRFDEAAAGCDRAISLKPDCVEAFNNRAQALVELKRHAEALVSCDRAIALRPDFAEAYSNRGNALTGLKRYEDALASLEQAIALRAGYGEAINNRANVLNHMRRFDEALASCEQAIALKPDFAEAFSNLGLALNGLKRYAEALASCDRAVTLNPSYAEAFANRACVLSAMVRYDEAVASYDQAIALKPDFAEAYFGRGTVLLELKLGDEAVRSLERAAALAPDLPYVGGMLFFARMQICDWTDFAARHARLAAAIDQDAVAIMPFHALPLSQTPSTQLACARRFGKDNFPPSATPLWRGDRYAHDRIRIGYLSTDFRDHAVAYLTAGLFGRHDRSCFETIGLSLGHNEPSAMRDRLKHSFDRFVDVSTMGDGEIARLVRELEIDIAVDLNGFTDAAQPNVFASRPAPVQVAYLGFAGTLGQAYWDYVIADHFVIPDDARPFYSEKVVHLPGSFMVNDVDRKIAERVPTRAEAGLPERGLVFCCFNNTYKITPDLFDVWMRVLGATDGSVLWLSHANGIAPVNLRREAEQRGIAGERLVFAPKAHLIEDHLARIRLADLFLDTLHYNAHTTAADALWAGVPVLTCAGETFVRRVAGSLLHAVGLPELVTHSLADYESLAVRLAGDPMLLLSLRHRLARNRHTHLLFDTDRFARHLEAAYTTMWQRTQHGEPPQSFAVAALP